MSGAQIGRIAIALIAITAFTSCGQPRQRKSLSRLSSELRFSNGASPAQASVKPQDQGMLTPLLGTYDGTLISNYSGSQPYTLNLSTETVTIEEDGQDYTFAKLNIDSATVHLESYLALQGGTVSGVPAIAFSSTMLSNPAISQNIFAIYMILATNGVQFLPAQSSIYLMDCGFTQGSSCASNTPVSTARFGTDLHKRL